MTLLLVVTAITALATGFLAGRARCARSERRQILDMLTQLDEHAAEYWRREETK
jgi:hypothetical protein